MGRQNEWEPWSSEGPSLPVDSSRKTEQGNEMHMSVQFIPTFVGSQFKHHLPG